jgi:hypothetical protein
MERILVGAVAWLVVGLLSVGCDCAINGRPFIAKGEIVIDPPQVPANGETKAEVSVWVYTPYEKMPIAGLAIVVISSRGDVDSIEQPNGPTDAEGKVVAYISSSAVGVAALRPMVAGKEICVDVEGYSCTEPVTGIVTFEPL